MDNPLIQQGLVRGCLGGLALAIVFLAISGGVYVFASQTSIDRNVVLLVSIASGPILGTLGTLGALYIRGNFRSNSKIMSDETTERD